MSVRSVTRLVLVLSALLLGAGQLAWGDEQVTVQITGLEGELLDNARASLTLERRRSRPGLDRDTLRQLYDQGQGEIARALEPFGYYRPEIRAELVEPAGPGGPWLVNYRVDPGPPLPIAAVDVSLSGPGAEDPALLALATDLPLRRDPTLDHRRYEAGKRELVNQVRELGYLDAELAAHRVEVDPVAYSARIRLSVATGPRYMLGKIEFDQDRFRPEYLARYLILQSGEPYRTKEVDRQRQLLIRSGHFREVEIERLATTAGSPPTIPLRIHLAPYPNNRYRGRVSWGTDTGFGVGLDWTRRYAGSRGQQFTVGAVAVQERNKLAGDLSYLIPLDPLAGSRIELNARHESKDLTYDDVELEEGGETRIETNLLSAFWHLPTTAWGAFEVRRTLGLSLVTESYDVFEVLFGNLPKSAQSVIIERIGNEAYNTLAPEFNAVVPKLSLILRRSADRLFVRDGDYIRLQLLGADEALGSNIDFWQARLDSWHIRPLGGKGRLLLRTALGYTEAENREVLGVNFNQMPEYYEFRAGGARSVRGYGFEELYPDDAITGGKHQLVGSIEYEHQIIPNWSAAVFLDAGNAFNRVDDFEAAKGVGIGLRWRSPVGLARIDLGFPLDDADDSFQIYITVGPEF